jgi:hypothetical protein
MKAATVELEVKGCVVLLFTCEVNFVFSSTRTRQKDFRFKNNLFILFLSTGVFPTAKDSASFIRVPFWLWRLVAGVSAHNEHGGCSSKANDQEDRLPVSC